MSAVLTPSKADAAHYASRAIAEEYNYDVVRLFAIATVVWGLVGMSVGVWIAAQLAYHNCIKRLLIRGNC